MSMRTIRLNGTLVAHNDNATLAAHPACDPFRAILCSKARVDFEFCAGNGQLRVGVGIQTSNDLETWTSHTGMGELIYDPATAGTHHSAAIVDLSGLTTDVQWVRIVFYATLNSGNTLATGFAQGVVEMVPRC
jgi:hypothetical protein